MWNTMFHIFISAKVTVHKVGTIKVLNYVNIMFNWKHEFL